MASIACSRRLSCTRDGSRANCASTGPAISFAAGPATARASNAQAHRWHVPPPFGSRWSASARARMTAGSRGATFAIARVTSQKYATRAFRFSARSCVMKHGDERRGDSRRERPDLLQAGQRVALVPRRERGIAEVARPAPARRRPRARGTRRSSSRPTAELCFFLGSRTRFPIACASPRRRRPAVSGAGARGHHESGDQTWDGCKHGCRNIATIVHPTRHDEPAAAVTATR